ncbi:glycosyltransferase family 2 protein [bacterium]|nr:glycosyltransferase family 2 protein [bacterium]
MVDVSLVIPALNEEGNIGEVIARAQRVLGGMGVEYQILICDGGSRDKTLEAAQKAGAEAFLHVGKGYGAALRDGFKRAKGEYIVTMDSDLSHEPEFIETLWLGRDRADIVIASRYVRGGLAEMSAFRAVLSRILNIVFTQILQIPVKDISSGFRLYRRAAIEKISFDANDFDVLEEILIRLYVHGFRVTEVPFHYMPRKEGRSNAKLFKFAIAYLKTLCKMMRLRWGRK